MFEKCISTTYYRFIVGIKIWEEFKTDGPVWAPEGKVVPFTELENPRGAGLKV